MQPVDLMVTELAVIGSPGGRATLLETAPSVTVARVCEATEGVGVRRGKPMPFATTDELMSGITIRAVRPDDKERLVTAFKALEPRSIYLRFFSLKKEISEQELRRVTECDGVSEVALVATIGGGDRETIIAMGNYVRDGAAAEIAFAVEEDFQGRGIAARLLQELAEIARTTRVSQLEADVLAENTPMLKVFRKSGLRMRESRSQGVVHATLLLT
jgi:GNAT superfamily N-acetyltransferase